MVRKTEIRDELIGIFHHHGADSYDCCDINLQDGGVIRAMDFYAGLTKTQREEFQVILRELLTDPDYVFTVLSLCNLLQLKELHQDLVELKQVSDLLKDEQVLSQYLLCCGELNLRENLAFVQELANQEELKQRPLIFQNALRCLVQLDFEIGKAIIQRYFSHQEIQAAFSQPLSQESPLHAVLWQIMNQYGDEAIDGLLS